MKKNCPYCSNPIYESATRCPFCGRNLDLELARKLERKKEEREQFSRSAKIFFLAFVLCTGSAVFTIWAAVYSPIGSRSKVSATQTAAAINFCNPQEVSSAARQLIDYNDRWADIMALAVSVDRSAIVVQVDRLQKIRRDARSVNTPDCMKNAQKTLMDGMEKHINGLLAYIRGEDLDAVNTMIMQGNLEMNTFADEVERLQRCAPDCW